MGSLTPGTTYIYERDGETVYAREAGAAPDTRQEVGWDYDDPQYGHKRSQSIHGPHDSRTADGRPLMDHIKESKLWGEIHRAAKTNPSLHEALERVKVIYYLSKEYEDRHGNRKT